MPNNGKNPKNYPYWNTVVKELKNMGYYIIQVGTKGEEKIDGVDCVKYDLDFNTELKKLLDECYTWFSVDTFFQHFATYNNKPGIVIFTITDPEIFGHKKNLNLYKDKKYFLENQFIFWEEKFYNSKSFIEPEEVISKFCEWSKTNRE